MPDTTALIAIDVDAELDRLAARYKAAGGVGIQVLNLLGGKADIFKPSFLRSLETSSSKFMG